MILATKCSDFNKSTFRRGIKRKYFYEPNDVFLKENLIISWSKQNVKKFIQLSLNSCCFKCMNIAKE